MSEEKVIKTNLLLIVLIFILSSLCFAGIESTGKTYSYNLDGTDEQLFTDSVIDLFPNSQTKNITEYNGMVYYTQFDKNDNDTYSRVWYRMKTDGTGSEKLTEYIGNSLVDEEYIYYFKYKSDTVQGITSDEAIPLCKKSFSDDNEIVLTYVNTDYAHLVFQTDNFIFFTIDVVSEENRLLAEYYYRMTKNGKDITRVFIIENLEIPTSRDFCVIGDKIYFNARNNDSSITAMQIYCMDINGTKAEKLDITNNMGAMYLTPGDDDCLYYVSAGQLHRLNTKTNETNVVIDIMPLYNRITKAGWVYFIGSPWVGDKLFYKVKTDGSEVLDLSDTELGQSNRSFGFYIIDNRIYRPEWTLDFH